MIPSLAVIHVERRSGKPIRLWLPVILIWLLLAPFVVVLAPFCLIAAAVLRVNPLAGAAAVGSVLWELGGLRIEVDSPGARILITMI